MGKLLLSSPDSHYSPVGDVLVVIFDVNLTASFCLGYVGHIIGAIFVVYNLSLLRATYNVKR